MVPSPQPPGDGDAAGSGVSDIMTPSVAESKSFKAEVELDDLVPTCPPGTTIDLTSEGPKHPLHMDDSWEFCVFDPENPFKEPMLEVAQDHPHEQWKDEATGD